MNLDQCIRTRRSVRKFTTKHLDDETIAMIVEAAQYAPSSGNVQNWRLIVMRDAKKREAITKACGKEHSWLGKAPVIIIVCSEMDEMKRLYGAKGEKMYAIQNCAAAIQNILLQAHSLGIGSCWVGEFDEKEIKAIGELEGHVEPQAIIALGYAKESPETPQRDPIEHMVFFEKYGKREMPAGRKSIIPFGNAITEELEKIKAKLHGIKKN